MGLIRVDHDRGLALFRFSGRMTVPQFRDTFVGYVTGPGFSRDHLMLSDLRAVDELVADFSSMFQAVQGLGRVLRQFDGKAHAVLMVESEVNFGIARMLQQVVGVFSAVRIDVARGPAEAGEYCGRSGEEMASILSAGLAAD
ncbi:MAG: hypothetical protein R3D63_16170 [Paracoccaceae bacterium]